jgi:phenylalanyl-tRNA synthetase beta chain
VDVRKNVRRTNNALRPTLLPSLCKAVKANQDAGNTEVSLYELSAVFRDQGPGQLPGQHTEIALVTTGDLRELRGAIEALCDRLLGQTELEVVQKDATGYAAGSSAQIRLDGKPTGQLGYLDPAVQDHYGLEKRIAAATVTFEAVLQNVGHVRKYQPVGKFPPVDRDLSLILDQQVTWNELSSAIEAVAQPLRSDLAYVTTYRGKQIPSGKKSVTLTLTYRSDEGTLRGEQVDEQVNQVVEALKKQFQAELRA